MRTLSLCSLPVTQFTVIIVDIAKSRHVISTRVEFIKCEEIYKIKMSFPFLVMSSLVIKKSHIYLAPITHRQWRLLGLGNTKWFLMSLLQQMTASISKSTIHITKLLKDPKLGLAREGRKITQHISNTISRVQRHRKGPLSQRNH